jgi:hypothetical protein
MTNRDSGLVTRDPIRIAYCVVRRASRNTRYDYAIIMKKSLGNKGLLDKSRFEKLERERIRHLQAISMKKGIRLAEEMLSCPLPIEWRDHFSKDRPVCLKLVLKRKRKS